MRSDCTQAGLDDCAAEASLGNDLISACCGCGCSYSATIIYSTTHFFQVCNITVLTSNYMKNEQIYLKNIMAQGRYISSLQ